MILPEEKYKTLLHINTNNLVEVKYEEISYFLMEDFIFEISSVDSFGYSLTPKGFTALKLNEQIYN